MAQTTTSIPLSLHRRTPHCADDWFSAEELTEAKRYAKPRNRVFAVGTLVSVGALIALVGTQAGARLLDGTAARSWGWAAQLAVMVFLTMLVGTVTGLAPAGYVSLAYDKKWGLSTNTPRQFAVDEAKQLLLSSLFGTVLLVPVYAAIRATDWWFVWGWAGFMLVMLAIYFVHPVLIMPRFNKFTPLPDGELRQRIEAVAALTGTTVQGVYTMDASKRTRRSNAFVTGFGATKRIVLFDTMLEHPIECVEQVVAHELGHYRLRHIGRTVLASAIVHLIAFVLVGVAGRWQWLLDRAGVDHLGDPATVPLFVLLLGFAGFALTAAQAWYSRLLERQADLEALELLREPEHFIEVWRRMAPKDKKELQPSWWSRLNGSHPEVAERMAFAQAWADAN